MSTMERTHTDYTVGWICVLEDELFAAEEMLHEKHPNLSSSPNDENAYRLGSIDGHNVVIACIPECGTSPAAISTAHMITTFPSLRFGLLVGIGAGIPSNGIQLGDVVVGIPSDTYPGVVQWDMGKERDGKFIRRGALNKPPSILLAARKTLGTFIRRKKFKPDEIVNDVAKLWPEFVRPQPSGHHESDQSSGSCKIHYGLIASGNRVISDSNARDVINNELGGSVLCIEMEAAGIPSNFPCLVIRGISDFADAEKNDNWHPYAALVAAAYARALLGQVHPQNVNASDPIQRILDDLSTQVKQSRSELHSIKEKSLCDKILQWLTPVDYKAQHQDIQNLVQPGTGQWFLSCTEYQSWLARRNKRLFCHGIPGTGKTFLATTVINDLYRTFVGNPEIGIVHFYCSLQRKDEQNVEKLQLGFLNQLAGQYWNRAPKKDLVRELYESHQARKTRPTIQEFGQLLNAILRSFTRVFIVVDALDEWGYSVRLPDLLTESRFPNTSLFATSRPLDDIVKKFDGSLNVKVKAQDSDLDIYLDACLLNAMPGALARSKNLQQRTKQTIKSTVNGMFLLARLYFDDVNNQITEAKVEESLEKFETRVGTHDILARAYDEAIDRIKSQTGNRPRLAQRALMWMTCVRKPVSISQLQHALAVEPDHNVFNPKNIADINVIVAACAGLIIEDNSTRYFRFTHDTTQEYLKQQAALDDSWFSNAEEEMAMTCMKYLSLVVNPLENKNHPAAINPKDEDHDFFIDRTVRALELQYPLIFYASNYWASHTNQSSVPLQAVLETTKLFDKGGRLTWQMLTGREEQEFLLASIRHRVRDGKIAPHTIYGNILHVAAYFNLYDLIGFLFSTVKRQLYESQLNDKAVRGPTPLVFATREGHEKTVQRLLGYYCVNVEASLESCKEAQSIAIRKGRLDIVKLLIDHCDMPSCNVKAFHLAAECGFDPLIRHLLDMGVEKDKTDGRGWTALTHAASEGRPSTVEILLSAGANIEVVDDSGSTPLIYASALGHLSVVEILLLAGANIDAVDDSGFTPLIHASKSGRLSVLKTLLASGANLNVVDKSRCTALTHAAKRGQTSIVQYLLAQKVDPNAKDEHGKMPLYFAVLNGDESVANQLLHLRKPEDDWLLYEALRHAFGSGHSSVFATVIAEDKVNLDLIVTPETLMALFDRALHDHRYATLTSRIDGRAEDSHIFMLEHGEPLLWTAALREHEEIYAMLLRWTELGSGVTKRIFHRALWEGQWTVFNTLLKNKNSELDLMYRNQLGMPLLVIATAAEKVDSVKLLLDRQDVQQLINETDSQGRSALHHAALHWDTTILQALLAAPGTNINLRDAFGQTPFILAAKHARSPSGVPRSGVLTALLETDGVDYNATNASGQTPLSLAAQGGHDEIVDLLLRRPEIDRLKADIVGRTPLEFAIMNGREKVVRRLLEDLEIRENLENGGQGYRIRDAILETTLAVTEVFFDMNVDY